MKMFREMKGLPDPDEEKKAETDPLLRNAEGFGSTDPHADTNTSNNIASDNMFEE